MCCSLSGLCSPQSDMLIPQCGLRRAEWCPEQAREAEMCLDCHVHPFPFPFWFCGIRAPSRPTAFSLRDRGTCRSLTAAILLTLGSEALVCPDGTRRKGRVVVQEPSISSNVFLASMILRTECFYVSTYDFIMTNINTGNCLF